MASITASRVTQPSRPTSAPSATTLTSLSSPALAANSVHGTRSSSTSGRSALASPSKDALATNSPPSATRGPNRVSDGGFITTAASYRSTTGEPISSSATITVQDAVPPRISGPYEGIQNASSPSAIAARARICPANRSPCPPNPAKTTERSLSAAFGCGWLSRRFGAVDQDAQRVHLLDLGQVLHRLGCGHSPPDRAVGEDLHDRAAGAG